MKAEARNKFPRNALKNFLFDLREEKRKIRRKITASICVVKKKKQKKNSIHRNYWEFILHCHCMKMTRRLFPKLTSLTEWMRWRERRKNCEMLPDIGFPFEEKIMNLFRLSIVRDRSICSSYYHTYIYMLLHIRVRSPKVPWKNIKMK